MKNPTRILVPSLVAVTLWGTDAQSQRVERRPPVVEKRTRFVQYLLRIPVQPDVPRLAESRSRPVAFGPNMVPGRSPTLRTPPGSGLRTTAPFPGSGQVAGPGRARPVPPPVLRRLESRLRAIRLQDQRLDARFERLSNRVPRNAPQARRIRLAERRIERRRLVLDRQTRFIDRFLATPTAPERAFSPLAFGTY